MARTHCSLHNNIAICAANQEKYLRNLSPRREQETYLERGIEENKSSAYNEIQVKHFIYHVKYIYFHIISCIADRQIDKLVYELYELTPEEIAIAEGQQT